MPNSQEALKRRVLLLAPVGRDAESAASALTGRGYSPQVVDSLQSLSAMLDEQVGAVVITSEALQGPGRDKLEAALKSQPSWSDLPFVYLAPKQTSLSSHTEILRNSWPAGMSNVMVLERPLSSESLASAVKWALNIRQRQFQTRDQFEKLAHREAQLRASQEAERAAAKRREFIFKIAERQRAAKSPEAVMMATATALAHHMRVDRTGFYRLSADGQTITFGPSHVAPALEPLKGSVDVAMIGKAMTDRLSLGRNMLVHGSSDRALIAGTILEKMGVVSVIGVPLIRKGRWVGGAYVHQMHKREWTDEDVSLVEEVVRLSWDAVKRAESAQALTLSEARFRGMIDSIEQMVWSTLPDGRHDYYNERWYAYTGLPRGSIDGPAWRGVVHPEDQSRASPVWRHCLRTGEPYRIEYRLRDLTGHYRWVLGRAQAVRDEDGRIVRWFGTSTDIQDIVDAREVLARSREELGREVALQTQERDRVWQVSRDLLGVADSHGVWLSINPAWSRVLGWHPQEIVGRTSEWLEHPEDKSGTLKELSRLSSAGMGHTFESRFKTSDGRYRLLEWRAVAMEARFYCVARDITEQRDQQLALRKTEEQLRQAQKMEAVGQLTGGIAHDFNNMLQGVTSALAAIRKALEVGQVDKIPRMLDIAQRSAFRAGNLTHRLLAFSRRQPLAPQTVDGNALVLSMEELMRRTLGENIQLEMALAAHPWPVHCDPNQLENALLNLVINARAAMPDGGTLRIATHNVAQHFLPSQQSSDELRDYLRIDVTDTGCGMPPEVIKRAFEPFFTTKPLGQGTGLGLSMIYGFAQQSGGACEIESAQGAGTTVRLYLPRLTESIDAPGPALAHDKDVLDPAPRFQAATVLLVEDEDGVRELVGQALSDANLEVMKAADSAKAMSLLDTGMRFDILITDVGLPGLNGRQLAEVARQRLPNIRVLFMTGYAESAMATSDSMVKAGMGLIVKPFDMRDLMARVRALLATEEAPAPDDVTFDSAPLPLDATQ